MPLGIAGIVRAMLGIRTSSGSSHYVALFTGSTPSSSNELTSSRNPGYSRKQLTIETYQARSAQNDTGVRKASSPAVSWTATSDWQDSVRSIAIMTSSSGAFDNANPGANVVLYDDVTSVSLANGGNLALSTVTYSLS